MALSLPTATVGWPPALGQGQRQSVIRCARWAQMAYRDATESPGTSNMTDVSCESCDARCLVFDADDGSLVVAVRGTDSAEDMLYDIRVVQTLLEDIPDALVHDGFNVQFKALSSVVNARVTRHLVAGGDLVCTGHSLGAGVAALFAVSYGVRFPGHVSYFGYGSPRQGNAVFMKLMRSVTSLAVIVKNMQDPVCASIPALCLPTRYEHAGLQVLIGRDPFPFVPNPLHVRDHDIARYVRNLEASVSSASTTPLKPVRQVCTIV